MKLELSREEDEYSGEYPSNISPTIKLFPRKRSNSRNNLSSIKPSWVASDIVDALWDTDGFFYELGGYT